MEGKTGNIKPGISIAGSRICNGLNGDVDMGIPPRSRQALHQTKQAMKRTDFAFSWQQFSALIVMPKILHEERNDLLFFRAPYRRYWQSTTTRWWSVEYSNR